MASESQADPSERSEIKMQLADAVFVTAAAYEATRQEFEQVKKYHSNLAHDRDRTTAFKRATNALNDATEKYRAAVMAFTKFVLEDAVSQRGSK